MKLGDTRKAAILMVVALGAVCFLFSQILPKKKLTVAEAAQGLTQAKHGDSTSGEQLTEVVIGDPFYNPRFMSWEAVHDKEQVEQARIEAAKSAGSRRTESSGDRSESLSGDIGHDSGNAPLKITSDEVPLPSDSNGKGQDLKQSSTHTILVSAIMKVDQPVALISIDKKDPVQFALGAKLAPGVKLIRIDDGSVVIEFAGKKKLIMQGDETKL